VHQSQCQRNDYQDAGPYESVHVEQIEVIPRRGKQTGHWEESEDQNLMNSSIPERKRVLWENPAVKDLSGDARSFCY
jgi:hypothetical protein